MLSVHDITYHHPDRELLFEHISISFGGRDKAAIIGSNGAGKSTLLKIMAGWLRPSSGEVSTDSQPYYVPQHFGQFSDRTIAEALQIEEKLDALQRILRGEVSGEIVALLDEDWTIEERSADALSFWNMQTFPLTTPMRDLSGGEKTKVFLAGIRIHQPAIVLLDEPTNHLDTGSRNRLYDFVRDSAQTLVVVSHDRTLLQLLETMHELDSRGITSYGGNYEFYREQKTIAEQSLRQQLRNRESALQKAIRTEREASERKQRKDVRGKKKLAKSGEPRILKKFRTDKAQASGARLRDAHAEKIDAMTETLNQIRQTLPAPGAMKLDFEHSDLHRGKVLFTAESINHGYGERLLWREPLTMQIRSGERINITGANGSGKTTLLRIILGEIEPQPGPPTRTDMRSVHIDQDYSLVRNDLSIYEQAQVHNTALLQEHEVKIRLSRFLFRREIWDMPCAILSGGEKMRLALCCLMIGSQAPDLFVLDEPTNNLDLQNTGILTSAINEYRGTVLVVSHDRYFLDEIHVDREIALY